MNVTPTARPTIPPSTAPSPTCKGDASYLQYSKEEGWIGFRGTSLLAIQPPDGDVLLSYFRVKYDYYKAFTSGVHHACLNKPAIENCGFV